MASTSGTFFDKFPTHTTKDSVLNLDHLLEFASVVIEFCDLQGKALYPVKSDVGGNIKKIQKSRQKYNANTVEELLSKETQEKANTSSSSGTVALLWLCRALELIVEVILELVSHPDDNMYDICIAAYSRSLMQYHNAVMKTAFYVGLKLFPDKHTFLLRLAFNQPNMEDVLMQRAAAFGAAYRNYLAPVHALLVSYGAEKTSPEGNGRTH